MTHMPIAPIAYKEMIEHLEYGNFLALPDHEALPKEWRGKIVDLEIVQTIVGSALSSLHAMPETDCGAQASEDVAKVLNLQKLTTNSSNRNMIEDEQIDCWEHAASLFEALSQAKFVNKK